MQNFRLLLILVLLCCLSACQTRQASQVNQADYLPAADTRHQLIISVAEQKMLVLEDGKPVASYMVSTARRGIGDTPDSYMTPGGRMQIAEKIGAGMPLGSVFKDRIPTGEVVGVDAPGRDPVVSRILWLRGTEERNRNAYLRFIYIHGTPQESLLGTPVSYGCIRMRSVDIAELFERVVVGAAVYVLDVLDEARATEAVQLAPEP